MVVSDDNIFSFSLENLIEKFNHTSNNIIVTRDIKNIMGNEERELNFATCIYEGEYGKIKSATYSFGKNKTISSKVILDIYLLTLDGINATKDIYLSGDDGIVRELEASWWNYFHAFEINDGFWADIGKKCLLEKAKQFYNQKSN